jgi:hypothetical protein
VLGREFAVAGMSVCESDRSISAILPNRNHGRYLPDAVRVLAAQDPRRTAIAARWPRANVAWRKPEAVSFISARPMT